MKPKVLLTRRWPQEVERLLEDLFDVTLNLDDVPMDGPAFMAAVLNHDAILPTVSDRLPPGLFEQERIRTRILGNFGVGYNHIDIAAARNAGIAVTNTPGVLTDCTADLALTLMLMISRRAGEGERQVRSGNWKGWCPTHMIGSKVSGKTLGIIGMGRIGKATAMRAHFGFGMKIIFYNRSAVHDPAITAVGATQFSQIEDVLANADYVSLHCPGGLENRNLIDAKRLAMMKRSAFLINTARGDIVDEQALIAALQEGVIAGAGLDVYANEPQVPQALTALENVVLLPHLGSATRETRIAMGMKVVENITAFFNGDEPPDRVA